MFEGGPEIPIFIVGKDTIDATKFAAGTPDLSPIVLHVKYLGRSSTVTTRILVSKKATPAQLYDYVKRHFNEQGEIEIGYSDYVYDPSPKYLPDAKSETLEEFHIFPGKYNSISIKLKHGSSKGNNTIMNSIKEERVEEEKGYSSSQSSNATSSTQGSNNHNLNNTKNHASVNQQFSGYCQPGLSEEDELRIAMAMSLDQPDALISELKYVEPIASKNVL